MYILQVYVNETAYLYNMIGILGLFMTTMLQSLRKPNDEDGYVQITLFRVLFYSADSSYTAYHLLIIK